MAYEHQEFPKWKYHFFNKSLIVNNAEEEASLGPDWYDSPAFVKPPKPPEPVAEVEVPKPRKHHREFDPFKESE